jgi:hypothetical protein
VQEVPEVRAEFEREISAPTRRSMSQEPTGLDVELTVRRPRKRPNIFKHRPGAAPETGHSLPMGRTIEEPRREPVSRQASAAKAGSDTGFRQRFGSYAGLAEAELTTYADLDPTPDPANSNTARPEPSEDATVVVPFPAPVAPVAAPRPAASFAERLASVLAESNDGRHSIGVELRRETATFRVPVSEAALPEALMQLTRGSSLQLESPSTTVPQLELALPAQPEDVRLTEAPDAAIELPDDSVPQDLEFADFEPPRVLRKMVE